MISQACQGSTTGELREQGGWPKFRVPWGTFLQGFHLSGGGGKGISIYEAPTKYHWLAGYCVLPGSQATGRCSSHVGQTGGTHLHRLQTRWRSNQEAAPGCWTPKLVRAPLYTRDGLQWSLYPGTAQDSVTQTTAPTPPGRDKGQREQVQAEGTGSGFKSRLCHLLTVGPWTNYPTLCPRYSSFTRQNHSITRLVGRLGR